MNQLNFSELDTIIPGVRDAYLELRSESDGLYTSRGRFYNKTIFGRDAAMSAKFVADFDHEIARDTIQALVRLQGTDYDPKTQEMPGRIHHEWRDFATWRGSFFEHLPFWMLHRAWRIKNRTLLTYFSLDTTASFIRLVHKYATHIDRSILALPVIQKNGKTVLVGDAVARAAEWIMQAIDDDGLVGERSTNRWALPFQTFQDSLYARSDGSLADSKQRITYIEVQALSADALYDAAHLLSDNPMHETWRAMAVTMHRSMLDVFHRQDGYLASAVDGHGQIDVSNVSAGWIFNTSLWRGMPDEEQEGYIAPVVERLFSDEFLTRVGLRTRSIHQNDPIKNTVDYHGSETVWPMFSFMVIEGLRRHRLYRLAEQLENRIINGLNASGSFDEYYIVQRNGTVVVPKKSGSVLDAQMIPERHIGFSVVPSLVMARRIVQGHEELPQNKWQAALEKRVLLNIEIIDRAKPADAMKSIGHIEVRRIRRWRSGMRVAYYFWRQR